MQSIFAATISNHPQEIKSICHLGFRISLDVDSILAPCYPRMTLSRGQKQRSFWPLSTRPFIQYILWYLSIRYGSSMDIDFVIAWWRHQMETFSALLALCAGNSPVPVNSLHEGQWRGGLIFFFICAWINSWVNNREAGDLRRSRAHYDVNVMRKWLFFLPLMSSYWYSFINIFK